MTNMRKRALMQTIANLLFLGFISFVLLAIGYAGTCALLEIAKLLGVYHG